VERICRFLLEESITRGKILALATYERAREVVPANADPYAGLREDSGLRTILRSSLYDKSVTFTAILDTQAVVVASSDPSLVGRPLPPSEDLERLAASNVVRQLQLIYSTGRTLEVRQPLSLGDTPFRIDSGRRLRPVLMRQALTEWLYPTIVAAAIALVIAIIVAGVLAERLLRPIHVIRSGLTRLGRGEFGVTLDLPPGDEFGETGVVLQHRQPAALGRPLGAGRPEGQPAGGGRTPRGRGGAHQPGGRAALQQPGDAGDARRRRHREADCDAAAGQATRRGRSSRDAGVAPVAGPVQASIREDVELLLMTQMITGTNGELVGVLLVARNRRLHVARAVDAGVLTEAGGRWAGSPRASRTR
jgi:hypothetical protein